MSTEAFGMYIVYRFEKGSGALTQDYEHCATPNRYTGNCSCFGSEYRRDDSRVMVKPKVLNNTCNYIEFSPSGKLIGSTPIANSNEKKCNNRKGSTKNPDGFAVIYYCIAPLPEEFSNPYDLAEQLYNKNY